MIVGRSRSISLSLVTGDIPTAARITGAQRWEECVSINTMGHIGICVTDMEASLRFWRDGLGFEVLTDRRFTGQSWKRILETAELDLRTSIIRRDHLMLELLEFAQPKPVGSTERSPMNRIGLTHIAIWVSDIEAVARRIVDYGGTRVEETLTVFDHPKLQGKWMVCCDPNGVRVELAEYPEGEKRLFG
jgi:lactoylglutathione lyase